MFGSDDNGFSFGGPLQGNAIEPQQANTFNFVSSANYDASNSQPVSRFSFGSPVMNKPKDEAQSHSDSPPFGSPSPFGMQSTNQSRSFANLPRTNGGFGACQSAIDNKPAFEKGDIVVYTLIHHNASDAFHCLLKVAGLVQFSMPNLVYHLLPIDVEPVTGSMATIAPESALEKVELKYHPGDEVSLKIGEFAQEMTASVVWVELNENKKIKYTLDFDGKEIVVVDD